MSDPTSNLGSSSNPDPDLESGQVVGEYEVDGKLGQGGFGAVFKAVHPLIGKVVAIKVLARKFSVDPEMVSRFIAEAKAVNQIRHRNIIDIFSFGQLPDGRHYYVMEYLDGEPLDKLLDRERRIPLAEALPILRSIARALDAAHGKGIAHRDLKPENIFLARDPDGGYFPKLLDFGIAKLMAGEDAGKHKTRTGMPIGTPYYMSPEQCRGKDVDHRTDYYAFGHVAYQMLTGEHAIDGDDFMAIMMKQIGEEPRLPSSVNPELPAGIDDVIAWLMAKKPADRPPSLVTAIQNLEAVAEQSGIAVPRSVSTRSYDSLKKIPTGQAGSAVAVAVATTMPSGAPVPGAPGLGPRATGLRRGVWIGALLGAIAIGGGVFYMMTRDQGATPSPNADGSATSGAGSGSPTPTRTPTKPVVTPSPEARSPRAAPAQPQTITLTLDGLPAGTEVELDHQKLGATPDPITLPRGDAEVELTFRHAGFMPATRKLIPDRDQKLSLALVRPKARSTTTTTTPAGSAHDPHSIEDPFQH